MKAIVFDEKLKLDNNYPKPIPQEGEALIRVTLAGICNTDFEITKGYILGRNVERCNNIRAAAVPPPVFIDRAGDDTVLSKMVSFKHGNDDAYDHATLTNDFSDIPDPGNCIKAKVML